MLSYLCLRPCCELVGAYLGLGRSLSVTVDRQLCDLTSETPFRIYIVLSTVQRLFATGADCSSCLRPSQQLTTLSLQSESWMLPDVSVPATEAITRACQAMYLSGVRAALCQLRKLFDFGICPRTLCNGDCLWLPPTVYTDR